VPDWEASTGQGQSVEVIVYNDWSSTVCRRSPHAPTPRCNREHTVYCVKSSHAACARKLEKPSDTHG
jgi:hypothetical protein